MSTVPVAVVQAGSILFDTDASIGKAERLLSEAARMRFAPVTQQMIGLPKTFFLEGGSCFPTPMPGIPGS